MTPQQARQVLNAPAGVDQNGLTRAFRAALKIAHPDCGGDGERLRLVVEAHALLKSAATAATSGSRCAPKPSRPATAVEVLEISVAEALMGGPRRLDLDSGSIDIRLPAGLRNGETLRLAEGGSQASGLLLRVCIREAEGMSVRGDDVWIRVHTSPRDGRIEIDTPRGRRTVWLSRKVGDKRLMRLAGEGLPARGSRRAGDLIVRLESPAPAESPARQMLRRFAGSWAAA